MIANSDLRTRRAVAQPREEKLPHRTNLAGVHGCAYIELVVEEAAAGG
jgi:hypothetical protein